MTLPPFPVDEITLNALKHSLNASFVGDEGDPEVVGAEYKPMRLLELLSGYDETVEHCPVYAMSDVVEALIAEVERLRADGA